jgi:hypothetical protein
MVYLHVFNMARWLTSSEIITSLDVKMAFLLLTERCAVWLTTRYKINLHDKEYEKESMK